MECKVIYKKLKNYCNYLLDIGFLTNATIDKFVNTFNLLLNYSSNNTQSLSDNNFNFNKFKDLLSNSLIFLLNSLNEDQKIQMARNIYIKYEKKINSQYILFFNIIYKMHKNFLLRGCLKKWKNNIENNQNLFIAFPFMSLLRGKRNYNANIIDTDKQFFINKTFNDDETNINNDNNTENCNNLQKVMKTYSKTNSKVMVKKYPLISEINNSLSKISKTNSGSKNISKDKIKKNKSSIKINLFSNSPNIRCNNFSLKSRFVSTSVKKIKGNFMQRLQSNNKQKGKKVKNLKKNVGKNISKKNSVSPKLKSSNSYRIKPTSGKDSKDNFLPINHLNKCKSYINIERQKEKNAVNYEKLYELYNDYKTLKNKINKKREVVNNELGLTFKPKLISDKKYFEKIVPDFYERENIFLAKKNNFAKTYKKNFNLENRNKKKTKNKKSENKINNNKIDDLAEFVINISEDEKDKNNHMEEEEGYMINIQEIKKLNKMKKLAFTNFLTNENDKDEDIYKDSSLLPLSVVGTLQTS